MRWNTDRVGDVKVITKFLWFPVWINHEYRWLEKATIRYSLKYRTKYFIGTEWRPVKFIDEEVEA